MVDSVSTTQTLGAVTINENFDALGNLFTGSRHASSCVGLTWAYYGGTVNDGGILKDLADGSITLANNIGSLGVYIELDPTGPTISSNTSGWTTGKRPLYRATTASGAVTEWKDCRDFTYDPTYYEKPQLLAIALSDMTTAITASSGAGYWIAPYGCSVSALMLSLNTASSSGSVVIDVNKNGSSVLGANKWSIDASETTSLTAATPPSITTWSMSAGDKLTFDIDSSGTGATGLQAQLNVTKTS